MRLYIKEPYIELNILTYTISEESFPTNSINREITIDIQTGDIGILNHYKTNSKLDMYLSERDIHIYGSFIKSIEYRTDGIYNISMTCDYYSYVQGNEPIWLLHNNRERVIDNLLNN